MNFEQYRNGKIRCATLISAVLAVGACSAHPEETATAQVSSALESALPISAQLRITKRWSSGYCARVAVKNSSSSGLSEWSVVIELHDANLDSIWNARDVAGFGLVVARPALHNAQLAPGESTEFGYCASKTLTGSNSTPTIAEAIGRADTDVPNGFSAELRLTSDWSSGYCADVEVSNPTLEAIPTWSVLIELKQSMLSRIWDAQATTVDSKLTARPRRYNASIAAGASTHFGFCATKTGADSKPEIVSSAPKILTVGLYIPRRITTCFIGDACKPGTRGCIGLRNDANKLVAGFTEQSFQAVRTTSPLRANANKEVCTELVMDDGEVEAIIGEIDLFVERVREWSHGDINLEPHTFELEQVDMDLSRWDAGIWVSPANLAEFVLPRLNFVPDFSLVFQPIRDPKLKLHHDIPGCGGTFGADLGIAGAGYSWIPKTRASFGFECSEQPVITHEWLHQVHWAYHQLSGFQDIYGSSFPGCGAGDPNPHKWFPDSHQCNADPDFERCGQTDCGSNDLVNSHILGEHWDPKLRFIANHCKNKLQDFGEAGIDSGGPCLRE